jgi:hypothetical protein
MADARAPDKDGKLEESVTDDIAGVQGGEDVEGAEGQAARKAPIGTVPDAPAPDGGEIEWAGVLIKKPPAPKS